MKKLIKKCKIGNTLYSLYTPISESPEYNIRPMEVLDKLYQQKKKLKNKDVRNALNINRIKASKYITDYKIDKLGKVGGTPGGLMNFYQWDLGNFINNTRDLRKYYDLENEEAGDDIYDVDSIIDNEWNSYYENLPQNAINSLKLDDNKIGQIIELIFSN